MVDALYLSLCVYVLSFIPLRWILVQPALLDDSGKLRAVVFRGWSQSASVWQVETSLLIVDAPVLPWARTLDAQK